MKFTLFHRGKHRQDPAEIRAERDALANENADLRKRLRAADELIAQLVEERDWFHAHWQEMGHQAVEAGRVIKCLEGQLAEALKVRADLEAIAGPHVPSDQAPTPVFAEVTQEMRLPRADPDGEDTTEITVKTLAAAAGAR